MAYYDIFDAPREPRGRAVVPADDLSSTASGEPELLRSAGFVRIAETDVTDEYLRVLRAVFEGRERRATTFRRLEGALWFEQGQRFRKARIEAIEVGLIRRALFVAERS